MKINGPGPVQAKAQVKRTRKGGPAGGGRFAQHIQAAEEGGTQPVAAAAPLAPVDALIALQEVPDALSGRGRAVRRGHDLLGLLDDVRHGLLSGGLSAARLERLAAMMRQRERVEDPRLAALLGEIETRAAVELAKLGRLG